MVRKISAVLICLAILLSFGACGSNVGFTEAQNKMIVSKDGTEYTFVGSENAVWCFGDREFIGHVDGEKKSFTHFSHKIKTGMYSVNGSQDVLIRRFYGNEFASIYVKSELLKKEVTLDNCVKFVFIKGALFNNNESVATKNGLTECKRFLNEIKNGQKAEDAGLYDLVEQPDGSFKKCYVYGYICGVIQEDLNVVIPLMVCSFNDKAYSIMIDDTEYVLPEEWLSKFTDEL